MIALVLLSTEDRTAAAAATVPSMSEENSTSSILSSLSRRKTSMAWFQDIQMSFKYREASIFSIVYLDTAFHAYNWYNFFFPQSKLLVSNHHHDWKPLRTWNMIQKIISKTDNWKKKSKSKLYTLTCPSYGTWLSLLLLSPFPPLNLLHAPSKIAPLCQL